MKQKSLELIELYFQTKRKINISNLAIELGISQPRLQQYLTTELKTKIKEHNQNIQNEKPLISKELIINELKKLIYKNQIVSGKNIAIALDCEYDDIHVTYNEVINHQDINYYNQQIEKLNQIRKYLVEKIQ